MCHETLEIRGTWGSVAPARPSPREAEPKHYQANAAGGKRTVGKPERKTNALDIPERCLQARRFLKDREIYKRISPPYFSNSDFGS
jgi:hypothetical protein